MLSGSTVALQRNGPQLRARNLATSYWGRGQTFFQHIHYFKVDLYSVKRCLISVIQSGASKFLLKIRKTHSTFP